MHVARVAGPSGVGKTTLIERLVPALRERGRTATVKSIHHDVEVDEPGKDTYRHRAAGAERVVGITPSTTFEVRDGGKSDRSEPLRAVLRDLADGGLRYVLVEGFSEAAPPAILVGEGRAVGGAVVARLSGGRDGEVGRLVRAIRRCRRYHTPGSLAAALRSGGEGVVATAAGRTRGAAGADAWTAEGSVPCLGGEAEAIREDLFARDGIDAARVYGAPPIEADGVTAATVAVRADGRDLAYHAAVDGRDRLADALSSAGRPFEEGAVSVGGPVAE